jgi:1-acyl-sn-glycerol-3-phosphate acyltransferase/nucleoside-diphosphate-sugar epimerase
MTKLVLIAHSRQPLAGELQRLLDGPRLIDPDGFCSSHDAVGAEAGYIYLPGTVGADGVTADEGEAQRVFQRATRSGGRQFVLLSSALIYGIGPGRQPLVTENYSYPGQDSNRIAARWRSLELLATTYMDGKIPLTILRPCSVLVSETFPAREFSRRVTITLPGHDPVFQFLSVSDLASAVRCVLEKSALGVFNVAPDTVIPLHKAVRAAKRARLAFPRTLQRMLRPAEQLEYLRYAWTISGEKLRRELGFAPRLSSLATLASNGRDHQLPEKEVEFDSFGMDKDYIRFFARTLFKFLSDFYWRVEDKGAEHIPANGPAVLVGVHRGFMPLDGVMALHTVGKRTGRYPRFLTHPALLKFPFLFNFMTKLGGVVACQESADRILKSNQLLGIFPEGIHGAFCYYRDAYKLHAFGRDAFVKLALRHRAPIIPFVTLGSAEIFPIFAKIKSRRWTRYTDWPCIPITPTFPLLPLPLPSKWHTQFLEPVSTQNYSPGAAEDRKVVSEISHDVRKRMQAALNDMLSRRRSIFFGSIFGETPDQSRNSPLPVQEEITEKSLVNRG